MRFATVAQVAALAEAIGPRYRALVLVAAYGGLRWGELVGLRVRRVDLLHGRVTVAEVNGRLIPGPPETEAGRRTVTLPAVAAVALAEHLAEFAEPGPDGLVFPAPQGGYLRRSNFRRRWWLQATRAAGLEGLRFHDLRHSAATLALAAGANTRELMERMGHTSPTMALRYQHVMAGRDQAIALAHARAALDRFYRWADGVEVAELSRLARTVRAWEAEILAFHGTGGCSNGSTEAVNLLVKKVKRVGRGFRNFTNYRLRLLLYCGVAWQTHRPASLRTRSLRW
jgi:Phage integrase family/Transposase